MMKKKFLIAAAAMAATLLLGACDFSFGAGTGGGGGSGVIKDYTKLNTMLQTSYSGMTIEVTDTFDEATSLKSSYTVKYSGSSATVTYSVERFSELSLDAAAPLKQTLKGTATISGGTMSVTGDDVGLTADIAVCGFDFKEEYFSGVSFTSMVFQADVVQPAAFVGRELACTGMRVEAIFTTYFQKIDLTYTAQGGDRVACSYSFTK